MAFLVTYRADIFVFSHVCYLGSLAIQLSSTGGGTGVEIVVVLISPMRTRASFRAQKSHIGLSACPSSEYDGGSYQTSAIIKGITREVFLVQCRRFYLYSFVGVSLLNLQLNCQP